MNKQELTSEFNKGFWWAVEEMIEMGEVVWSEWCWGCEGKVFKGDNKIVWDNVGNYTVVEEIVIRAKTIIIIILLLSRWRVR